MKRQQLLRKAQSAARESRYVDFKAELDTSSKADWCELVKDIVAMANSGGGAILIGVGNDGRLSGFDHRHVLEYDGAKVTDTVHKFTGRHFDGCEILEIEGHAGKAACILVNEVAFPMVFCKAGLYRTQDGKEKVAFQNGTVYFRHGSKSEPCTSADLERSLEREVNRRRREWLSRIRKVISAPADSEVFVGERSPGMATGRGHIAGTITTASGSSKVHPIAGETQWPHHAKEVVRRVNVALAGHARINGYDVLAVRDVLDLEEHRPDMVYRAFKDQSPRFSDALVEFLVRAYEAEHGFFRRMREMKHKHQHENPPKK